MDAEYVVGALEGRMPLPPSNFLSLKAPVSSVYFQQICDALRTNRTVLGLRMEECGLVDWQSAQLADALLENMVLETLELGGNAISNFGAQKFATLLQTSNTSLQVLDLTGNPCKEQAPGVMAMIEQSLQRNRAMKTMARKSQSFSSAALQTKALPEAYGGEQVAPPNAPPLGSQNPFTDSTPSFNPFAESLPTITHTVSGNPFGENVWVSAQNGPRVMPVAANGNHVAVAEVPGSNGHASHMNGDSGAHDTAYPESNAGMHDEDMPNDETDWGPQHPQDDDSASDVSTSGVQLDPEERKRPPISWSSSYRNPLHEGEEEAGQEEEAMHARLGVGEMRTLEQAMSQRRPSEDPMSDSESEPGVGAAGEHHADMDAEPSDDDAAMFENMAGGHAGGDETLDVQSDEESEMHEPGTDGELSGPEDEVPTRHVSISVHPDHVEVHPADAADDTNAGADVDADVDVHVRHRAVGDTPEGTDSESPHVRLQAMAMAMAERDPTDYADSDVEPDEGSRRGMADAKWGAKITSHTANGDGNAQFDSEPLTPKADAYGHAIDHHDMAGVYASPAQERTPPQNGRAAAAPAYMNGNTPAQHEKFRMDSDADSEPPTTLRSLRPVGMATAGSGAQLSQQQPQDEPQEGTTVPAWARTWELNVSQAGLDVDLNSTGASTDQEGSDHHLIGQEQPGWTGGLATIRGSVPPAEPQQGPHYPSAQGRPPSSDHSMSTSSVWSGAAAAIVSNADTGGAAPSLLSRGHSGPSPSLLSPRVSSLRKQHSSMNLSEKSEEEEQSYPGVSYVGMASVPAPVAPLPVLAAAGLLSPRTIAGESRLQRLEDMCDLLMSELEHVRGLGQRLESWAREVDSARRQAAAALELFDHHRTEVEQRVSGLDQWRVNADSTAEAVAQIMTELSADMRILINRMNAFDSKLAAASAASSRRPSEQGSSPVHRAFVEDVPSSAEGSPAKPSGAATPQGVVWHHNTMLGEKDALQSQLQQQSSYIQRLESRLEALEAVVASGHTQHSTTAKSAAGNGKTAAGNGKPAAANGKPASANGRPAAASTKVAGNADRPAPAAIAAPGVAVGVSAEARLEPLSNVSSTEGDLDALLAAQGEGRVHSMTPRVSIHDVALAKQSSAASSRRTSANDVPSTPTRPAAAAAGPALANPTSSSSLETGPQAAGETAASTLAAVQKVAAVSREAASIPTSPTSAAEPAGQGRPARSSSGGYLAPTKSSNYRARAISAGEHPAADRKAPSFGTGPTSTTTSTASVPASTMKPRAAVTASASRAKLQNEHRVSDHDAGPAAAAPSARSTEADNVPEPLTATARSGAAASSLAQPDAVTSQDTKVLTGPDAKLVDVKGLTKATTGTSVPGRRATAPAVARPAARAAVTVAAPASRAAPLPSPRRVSLQHLSTEALQPAGGETRRQAAVVLTSPTASPPAKRAVHITLQDLQGLQAKEAAGDDSPPKSPTTPVAGTISMEQPPAAQVSEGAPHSSLSAAADATAAFDSWNNSNMESLVMDNHRALSSSTASGTSGTYQRHNSSSLQQFYDRMRHARYTRRQESKARQL